MHFHAPAAERLWWLGTIPSQCVYNRSELTYYQVFFPPFLKKKRHQIQTVTFM
uniref:Uncharacterized protein n=1 Tax=Escherichia coli TaxID=562 RepID=H1ZXV1_ECOLX|nr:hypothetical protein MM3_024 [Escherichia coli]